MQGTAFVSMVGGSVIEVQFPSVDLRYLFTVHCVTRKLADRVQMLGLHSGGRV